MGGQLKFIPIENGEGKSPSENNEKNNVVAQPQPRKCEFCGNDISSKAHSARFCSVACLNKARRARLKQSSPGKADDSSSPFEKFAKHPGADPYSMAAIELYRSEIKRLQNVNDDERARREKIEKEFADFREQAKDKEHKAALQGVEDKKPDIIDRILNMPETTAQLFGPIVAKIANLIPDSPAGGAAIAGVGGQLDETSSQFLAWVAGLPEPVRGQFVEMMLSFTAYNPEALAHVVARVRAAMKGPHINESMYG